MGMLTASCLLAAAPSALAQDPPQRFEVDLFVGTAPTTFVQNAHFFDWGMKYYQPAEIIPASGTLASIYEPKPVYKRYTDAYATPYVGLRFGYRVKRWLKVGADLGWDRYREVGHYSDETVKEDILHTVTFIPKVTFFFATSRYVSAYAGAGIGMAFQTGTPGFEPEGFRPVNFAWQLTPIGITVGRRIPGFTELTIGKDVIGIKFGVGYRF